MFELLFRDISKIFTCRGFIHCSTPFYTRSGLHTHESDTEIAWKTYTVCAKIAKLGNIAYERQKHVSWVTKLMPSDGKVLAYFSLQLRDNSKYHSAVNKTICSVFRQTAKQCQKYPQKRLSTKLLTWPFIIHYLKSLYILK